MSNETLLQPLLTFKEQFDFVPEINNAEALLPYNKVTVCGMGGSAISTSFLSMLFPSLKLTLHNSYGLPFIYKKNTLFVINSYSGNTEEAIDAYKKATYAGVPVLVISKGGTLLEIAKKEGVPYIELPNTGLEPRFAIGHQMLAILTACREKKYISILSGAAKKMELPKILEAAEILATRFTDRYPVLYSSSLLYPLAYPIKAAINEGAKIPAFINILPEANHNELQSFITSTEENVSNDFAFLFFTSPFDNERIKKRIHTMKKLYSEAGFVCEEIVVDHTSTLSLLESLFFGYSFATHVAIKRNVDPYTTPFIQEFKKKMAS